MQVDQHEPVARRSLAVSCPSRAAPASSFRRDASFRLASSARFASEGLASGRLRASTVPFSSGTLAAAGPAAASCPSDCELSAKTYQSQHSVHMCQ
jgi:hypothetical protein